MAILVNKMNREVKVIIPNMREFRVFYSDNEGSVMFFKRDWGEEKQEEHWKPSEEQMEELNKVRTLNPGLDALYQQLKNM